MAIESVNPATGERLATFAEMGPAELDSILDAAVGAQRLWSSLPFTERAIPMKRAAALLPERTDEYAKLMALEIGKPLKDGAAEVTKCGWVCDYNAENAASLLAPREEASDASRSYVRFEPLGVLLALMPCKFATGRYSASLLRTSWRERRTPQARLQHPAMRLVHREADA